MMEAKPTTTTTDELLSRLLLTKDEVATVLSVPVATVENLNRTHRLRAVRIGKHDRWRPDDVRRFVQEATPGEDEDGHKSRR